METERRGMWRDIEVRNCFSSELGRSLHRLQWRASQTRRAARRLQSPVSSGVYLHTERRVAFEGIFRQLKLMEMAKICKDQCCLYTYLYISPAVLKITTGEI